MRIASYNVENLFSRAKVLNLRHNESVTAKVKKIGELQDELQKDTYNKNKILELYNELKTYIKIYENRGKLFRYTGTKIIGVKANGRADWDGEIGFKREEFNEMARKATAKVIKDMKPDLLCLVEVEDRLCLEYFYTDLLKSDSFKMPYNMCIDGNDARGIDVGLLSKYPIKNIKTHIYDKEKPTSRSYTFSRDCLEIELELSKTKSLYILCNHFVSKLNATNDVRRKKQATAVRDIIKANYDLSKDYVIVAGDFNDTPDSATLAPLTRMNGLNDVLELQFGDDIDGRWTYHYKTFEQIDFILVSDALAAKFVKAGVERRGIYEIEELTDGAIKRYPDIKEFKDTASDHAGIWAEFDL